MKYDYDSFVKKVDREMSKSFIVFNSFLEIVANRYFPGTTDNMYQQEFYEAYMIGEVKVSLLRKIIRSSEFGFWARSVFCFETARFLDSLVLEDNGRIRVYRSIGTNYDWVKKTLEVDVVKLGQSWSFLYSRADFYCIDSMHENKYIFSGTVAVRDIDWTKVYLLNLSETFKNKSNVRLFGNRKLKDFCVEKKGELFVYKFKPAKVFKS